MGNQSSTCGNFCDNQQQIRLQQTQLKMAQYPLQCIICKKQVQHIKFNKHLDLVHFANIQQKNDIIAVNCILCDTVSDKLQSHQKHLYDTHHYINAIAINQQQNATNKMIKSKLKQLDAISKIKIISRHNQLIIAQYQQDYYELYITQKQYDGMQYDELQVLSQLVLFPVFVKYRNRARYYFMQKNALQRTIKCKSFILCVKT